MPGAKLTSRVAAFCFALLWNGFQKALALLGKSMRRRTFRMMPRLPYSLRYLLRSDFFLAQVAQKFRVSSFDPDLFSRFATALAQRAPLLRVLMIFLGAANRTFSRMRAPLWSTTLGACRARKSRLRMLRRTCPIPTDSHAI